MEALLKILYLEQIIGGTWAHFISVSNDDNSWSYLIEMHRCAVSSSSWHQKLYNLIKVSKIIDKDADDISEETEKTGMQDVIKMFDDHVFSSLNRKWFSLTEVWTLDCQGYHLTETALHKEDKIIEESAYIVNS